MIGNRYGILMLAASSWLLLCGMGPYRSAGAGTSSLGLADAQVASGVASAALYSNPAGMSQVQHSVFETGFARSGQAGSGAPFVSYVDSTSAWGLAAGVGYAGELGWSTDAPIRRGHDVRMGLSMGGQSETTRLLVGASARYLNITQGGHNVDGWTGDLGVTVGLQNLRLGAVVHNGLQLDPREAPRRVAVGAAFVGTQLVAEASGSWGVSNRDTALPGDGDGQSYRAGIGYQVGAEGLQLRAGYQFDQIVRGDPTRHWVCGGLSWRTTKAGIDFGGGVDAANQHATMVSVSVVVLVPTEISE
jgi:hypothetical protein